MDFAESKKAASEFCRGQKNDAKTETGGKRVSGAEETSLPTQEKAVKAVKKEADKDGRDEAEEEEEEDVNISKVGLFTSATETVGEKRERNV